MSTGILAQAQAKPKSLTREGPKNRLGGPAIFALAYVFYFGFGSINFVPRRGIVGFDTILVVALGLVAYCIGAWVRSLTLSSERRQLWRVRDPIGWRSMAWFLGLLGLFATVGIVVSFGGLPLLGGERRNTIPPTYVALLTGLYLALAIVSGFAISNRRWRILSVALAFSALLLLLGYRTFVLVPLLTAFMTAYCLGVVRFRARWVFGGSVAAVSLAWIGMYRFDSGANSIIKQFLILGWPEKYSALVPLWLTPREGTSVLANLVDKFPESYDFRGGGLLASTFLTMLPGNQLGPRLEVAAYVAGRRGQSITPSILGQPYVDFGIAGVMVSMLIVGFGLKWLWWWQERAITWAPKVASSFTLSILLVDIHAGLLDVQFIGGIVFIVIWAHSAEVRAAANPPPT